MKMIPHLVDHWNASMIVLSIIVVTITHRFYYVAKRKKDSNEIKAVVDPVNVEETQNVQRKRQRHFDKLFENANIEIKVDVKRNNSKQKVKIPKSDGIVRCTSNDRCREVNQIASPLRSSSQHPGLEEFNKWMDAISGIYRSYSIGKYSCEIDIPIIPKSERGRIETNLSVKNLTEEPIHVFWIDYKGNEISKGTFGPNHVWTQITWVGHPWVFRNSEGRALVFYVPYRVIPKLLNDDPTPGRIGSQSFTITKFKRKEDHLCSIQDGIFPLRVTSVSKAIEFSCEQMERENASPRPLLKYLYNIALHPDEKKYRQIRTANKIFWNNVWITGGRGVLHALGFVEFGAYLEMGPNEGPLGRERIQQISEAITALETLQSDMENPQRREVIQPLGADGNDLGRAGWA